MAGSGLINVEFNKAQVKEVKRLLSAIPRGYPKAASRAINKTATTIRSKITKLVRQYIPLKLKDIRKKIVVIKANRSRLFARIRVKGGLTPLIKFGARETKSGVSFKVAGKREKLRHAFISTMPSGHQGVFERQIKGGKPVARLSIDEKFGPSVLTAYLRKDHHIRVQAADLLQKNLASQVKLLLEKK